MARKSMDSAPEAASEPEVFVLSQHCTTHFPDLDLTLEAGEVTCIPETFLARALSEPGVVQLHPAE